MRVFVLLLFAFFTLQAFACSCAEKPTVKEGWEMSADVYTVEVISVDSTSLYSVYGGHVYLFKVKILQSYKNQLEKGYEIRSIYADPGSTCDYLFFKPGEKYLIYTRNNTGIVANVSICSRTNKHSAIKAAELQELQTLYATGKNQSNEIEMQSVINSKEYDSLKMQTVTIRVLSDKIEALYYTIGAVVLLCLILIVLYIKTKRQYKPNTSPK
ncbi:hypothetical protein [Flavobacterium subsaxonicum]|uniref:Tissue inhibitor of metalloproteinase n=1 Tax=Flavobacterium subsaxonicum WB 4.1-42 = DSM 21790 TaxID=1121898 RepID=A0A0A2MM44_9FLAO|nr:hypothetical protein [Flavobacterium subsaxonicum]KGO92563.1 hypothetical protein Q766_12360 [Flavobacterium subsaxonicum WB 4.1-42 = DSM 21790]